MSGTKVTQDRPPLKQPGPFLKWAGGKSRLLPHILPRLPARMRTYYEPFLGGGAVFFALAQERRFREAILGDLNPALVEVYTVVRDDLEALIDGLKPLAEIATDAEAYYAVRSQNPADVSPVERAARFIFLNKTCFNGLYRVNRKGQFNVPFGRYTKPRVLDAPRLRAASRALQGVTILEADFAEVVRDARPGDGVYLDPPYAPRSKTASFTAYTALPFGREDHVRLAEAYRTLAKKGVAAVLSNADTSFTAELYEGLALQRVQAKRAINSVGSRRGAVSELLVGSGPHAGAARSAIVHPICRGKTAKEATTTQQRRPSWRNSSCRS